MTTSIIIPVFNEEQYLPKLLDSIIQQTMMVNQVIICDNQSTDTSVSIARSYQDRLPLIVAHEPVKGIVPTVDKAWRMANTDLILKVDSDTVLPKHWVRRVVDHFEKDPQLEACTGPWLPADGRIFNRIVISLGSYCGAYFIRMIKGYPLLLGPNSAFRQKSLEHVDGYTNASGCIDDQIISQKLKKHSAKMGWFRDCMVYHSIRRWQGNPKEYINTFLSLFNPKFYNEKQN